MSEDNYIPPSNRSEIALLYDAKDTNPNGDPLSSDNRPRIDPVNDRAIVTDVRLKRYIRDQLFADGENILVKKSSQIDEKPTRERLYESIKEAMENGDNPTEAFLNTATDVRYFGATISIDSDIADELPDQFIGPVQFQTGRSYNPVEINEATQKLTTVIYRNEDAEQGTFATDLRLQYALIGFSGVVNENAAENTRLRPEDVERLDTLIWRALTNQTLTRSKVGQQPRLYVRLEYDRDDFHIGNIDNTFDMETDKPLSDVRHIDEYALDITEFLETLQRHSSAIDTVHIEQDDRLDIHVEQDDLLAPNADEIATAATVATAVEHVEGVDSETIGVYQSAAEE